ncbi:MAG: HlyD family efflux transporter periplasmic adaptor subunit [Bacteroidales bacterium]|nr:HlyD family efflux transporter periplasmic adaptor subunit [Bacteroidales bacterium]
MAKKGSVRQVELHSNEVEDMLGRVPGWITRNGMILFVFLLVLLLLGSWIFRYPDIKKARIVVTSVNPPADLKARSSGKIVGLYVVNNQLVKNGTVLAMIENPAVYDDVVQLKNSLLFLDTIAIEAITEDLTEMKNVKLGTIQTHYSMFLKVYRDYMEFRRIDYHQRKVETARTELEKQREYTRSLSERIAIQEQAYELALRQFNRDASLFEEGVISASELEESRSEMLNERNKRQEIISLMAENNISISRTENQIVDLELKQQEERSGMISALGEAYSNLKAAITSWEQTYLLVAPVDGTVTFTRFWSENQNVRQGEKVLTIIPAESGSMIGKISLPLEGAGKVNVGNQVNIQFDNFPHLEYGMVKGFVSNISGVSDDDFYTVEVELPDGLRSYYDYEILFSQNMQGDAEILTDKKRLLERVLNPLRSALSKQAEM